MYAEVARALGGAPRGQMVIFTKINISGLRELKLGKLGLWVRETSNICMSRPPRPSGARRGGNLVIFMEINIFGL